jgi:type IV secretion system protein VirB10
VAYGQDGVQVAWSRIIFPDASSIDLNGMVGLDSHGNSGLRDKVDRHYARIVGFSALTSLFSAAFAISQRQNQSVLAYPIPTKAASGAVGRELSQAGSQITRRNLNVQTTVRVAVGYKFTVRVNRDILVESPYQPLQADPQPTPAKEKRSGRELGSNGCGRPEQTRMIKSAVVKEFVAMIEAGVKNRPSPCEFEMTYQARVAIDRIRFAVRATEMSPINRRLSGRR